MKMKFLFFLMALGMLMATPKFTFAQYTDEDFEMEGMDATNNEFGPVSIDPVLINGTLSHVNKTITLNFLVDLGSVVITIVDEKGNVYVNEEVNSSKEASKKIDIKSLPAQKYTIICIDSLGKQGVEFELHE